MLRKDVLRKKADFDRVYNKGKSAGDRYVVVFCKSNGLPFSRTAFLASKKVGISVERNRARRLMKESFRSLSESCKEGMDYIFIARNTIVGTKCDRVANSMKKALAKAGALK